MTFELIERREIITPSSILKEERRKGIDVPQSGLADGLDTVTQDDINMIEYFILWKGDITRWSSWDERKPIIAKEYPELIVAMDALVIAKRTLYDVVQNVVSNVSHP